MTQANTFPEQLEQKLDILDIEKFTLPEYLYTTAMYDSEKRLLHRDVTLKEFIEYYNFQNPSSKFMPFLHEVMADLKEKYLIFDAKYLYGLGYREIYYKDLNPGSICIVYNLYVRD